MPLSSSSVVHFTSKKENLVGILSENFKMKFCRENLPFKTGGAIRVPMVSFCDIPLSQVKDHMWKYGEYGIGLTKNWAIKKRMNPVLYVDPKSMIAESYDTALSHFHYQRNGEILDGMAYRHLLDLVRYMKPYEGLLRRSGVDIPDYRYYDEREWRYVPSVDECEVMHYLDMDFDDDSVREEAISSISSIRLNFEVGDIKYLIISKDDEIHEFLEDIKACKAGYTSREVELLATRINTAQQIRCDF